MLALSILGLLGSTLWIVLSLVDHGTFEWSGDGRGPVPAIFFAFCPRDDGWVKLQMGIGSRQFWMNWGE